MRILIVSDAWRPQVNGVVRTYEHIMDEVHQSDGHRIDVIGPEDFPVRLPMPGYSEIRLAFFPYRRLARMIGRLQPESIHIATEGPLGKAARRYCLRHDIPFTTAYHTQFPDYIEKRLEKISPALARWGKNKARKMMLDFHNRAQAILVTTKSLEAELKEIGYTPPLYPLTRGAPLHVFYPGEPEQFKDMKRPVALYVGRVAVEKNLEDFLSMDWDGTKAVVGVGPSMTYLKEKYPDVLFAGKQTGAALASYYRSADIFVFPSRTDTFGIVLLEALASGLPVAAYNVTGPKDIITAPHLGTLHDDLAQAAREALAVAERRMERHKHIREHYSWQKAAEQFLDTQGLFPVLAGPWHKNKKTGIRQRG